MTASRWPMRWQRSSAWSCIAGRPLELEEGDVRRARQRDALGGDARRADDQLRAVGLLEGARRPPRAPAIVVARRAGAARRGSARAPPPGPRRGGRRRRAARREARKSSIQASAACELAARGQPLQRAELREALGAQRRRDLARRARAGRAAARAARRSRPARRAGTRARCRARPGTTTWRLAGSCGSTSDFRRRTKQRAAQVPVQALLASSARGTGARSARRSRSPRAGRCTRSWAISSSAWFSTGVPVSASRSAVRGPRARPAGAPPACAWPAGSCT